MPAYTDYEILKRALWSGPAMALFYPLLAAWVGFFVAYLRRPACRWWCLRILLSISVGMLAHAGANFMIPFLSGRLHLMNYGPGDPIESAFYGAAIALGSIIIGGISILTLVLGVWASFLPNQPRMKNPQQVAAGQPPTTPRVGD